MVLMMMTVPSPSGQAEGTRFSVGGETPPLLGPWSFPGKAPGGCAPPDHSDSGCACRASVENECPCPSPNLIQLTIQVQMGAGRGERRPPRRRLRFASRPTTRAGVTLRGGRNDGFSQHRSGATQLWWRKPYLESGEKMCV